MALSSTVAVDRLRFFAMVFDGIRLQLRFFEKFHLYLSLFFITARSCAEEPGRIFYYSYEYVTSFFRLRSDSLSCTQ